MPDVDMKIEKPFSEFKRDRHSTIDVVMYNQRGTAVFDGEVLFWEGKLRVKGNAYYRGFFSKPISEHCPGLIMGLRDNLLGFLHLDVAIDKFSVGEKQSAIANERYTIVKCSTEKQGEIADERHPIDYLLSHPDNKGNYESPAYFAINFERHILFYRAGEVITPQDEPNIP